MPVTEKYKTSATATGGRDGTSATHDGSFSVKLALPKELGGNGDGNNPEQLFAAGYAACFLGAMKAAARDTGIKVPDDTKVTAHVGLGPRDEGGFGITAALEVSMPGVPAGDVQALADKAHNVICPYSNAIRGNVDVKVTVA